MRHEFSAAAIREADARAGDRCEATGERYGLPPGKRCNADLTKTGRQRDHYPRGAHDPHPETRTARNCVVCCPKCNQYAANHTDKRVEAKIKRVGKKRGRTALQLDRPIKPPSTLRNRSTWPPRGSHKLSGRAFQQRQKP